MVEEIDCPTAIATTYTGKTLRGLRELKDIIFLQDPSVKVEITKYSDVLLLYTSLSRDLLKKLINEKRPSAVARVVIADTCFRVSKENYFNHILAKSIELLMKKTDLPIKFYVDCVSRGEIIESCRMLEIEIGRYIEKAGIGEVSFKKPTKVLKIEVVDDIVILALIDPDEDRIRKPKR
ncbi:MAG: hypothetical protein ACP5GI_02775 [Sulfolobales archaeon]